MKQLLREVLLPLDLAFRDLRHIRNCIRNEELHRVDDMLWEKREDAVREARGLFLLVVSIVVRLGEGGHCGRSVSNGM